MNLRNTEIPVKERELSGAAGAAYALVSFFALMRPKQWTKNLLVFAALIFSIKVSNMDMLWKSVIGFLLFCLVSSCVYVLNDYMDREADREHPEKKHRPLASGALNSSRFGGRGRHPHRVSGHGVCV